MPDDEDAELDVYQPARIEDVVAVAEAVWPYNLPRGET